MHFDQCDSTTTPKRAPVRTEQRARVRRKRLARRLANDLRLVGPLLGVLSCFVTSATTIAAAERIPSPIALELPGIALVQMDKANDLEEFQR